MESMLLGNKLTTEQIMMLKKYEREKRMQAFQKTFEMYKETIGDWELTDFKDAGENWRTESKLKCECGRILRYQYTVTNRNTAEILSFGIDHLKGHTNFSNNVIREINKHLRAAEKDINEVKERLIQNWTLDMEIPNELVLPDTLKKLLEEGLPLSRAEESHLTKLIQTAKSEKWERERKDFFADRMNRISEAASTVIHENEKKTQGKIKRIDPTSGPFDLWEHEMAFVDDMLAYGVGSAMIISEELHASNYYIERFLTGRPKVYPSVVFYLDRLVREGKAELSQNLGLEDRVYKSLK